MYSFQQTLSNLSGCVYNVINNEGYRICQLGQGTFKTCTVTLFPPLLCKGITTVGRKEGESAANLVASYS